MMARLWGKGIRTTKEEEESGVDDSSTFRQSIFLRKKEEGYHQEEDYVQEEGHIKKEGCTEQEEGTKKESDGNTKKW